MKKVLSVLFCCLCLWTALGTQAFASDIQLQTENIPEAVKNSLTAVYNQSRNAMTDGEISLFYEAELIGTSNFGDNIMGGLFSDGSFVLTGTGDMTYRPSDVYDDFITSVYIDNGVTSLYDECFKDCTALEYVYIMGSVSDMGDYTFADCPALHTIVLEEGVTGMGRYTFSGCTGIQNLKLPSTLKITATAFNNCTSLVTAGPMNGSYIVEFNRGSRIPDNYFAGMYYLQELTVPSGVTDIGNYAFGDCTSLSLICLPDSVKNIGRTAFYNMQETAWVYYAGSQTQYSKINISAGNDRLKNAYHYYETVPQVKVTTSLNYTPEISWDEVPFALGYEVFYALDAGTYYEYLTSATYPATSVTHTTAVTGETYRYVVRALMPEKRYGDFSKSVSYTVPSAVPKISARLNSKDKPVITWNAINGMEKYRLYRSETGPDSCFKLMITTDSTTSIHSGAKPGKKYYYKVQAVSDTGIGGPFSKCIAVEVPMESPRVKTVLNSDGKPVISWNAVDGAEKYEVYRSYSKNGEYTRLITTVKLKITNSGAAQGKTCYYKVIPVSASGVKGNESSISSVYVPYKLSVPEAAVELNINGKPVISWKAVTNGEQYEVYRSSSANGEYTRLITTAKTDVTHYGTAGGKTHYYKVRAVAPDGTKSSFGDILSVKVPVEIASPTVTVSLNASKKPVISWKAVTGAAKYEVYRSENGGEYTRLILTSKKSVTHTGAKEGAVYSYKVRAVGSNGIYSNFSAVDTITVPQSLAAPELTVKLNASGKPVISWNTVSGAEKYEVWRSENGGEYKRLILTVKASVTHTGAKPGVTYSYKVRAVDADNNYSKYSAADTITVPQTLTAPEAAVQLNASGKPVISWNAVNGAEKYEVYRSENGGEYKRLILTVKTSVTHTGAKAGSTYSYKIRAVIPDTVYGPYSTVVETTAN